MIATYSLRPDGEVDAAQRAHDFAAHVVVPLEAAGDDDPVAAGAVPASPHDALRSAVVCIGHRCGPAVWWLTIWRPSCLGVLVRPSWLAHERAVLQFANRLVRAADDLLAGLEARQDLEVLLAGDTYLYGPEGDFVVRSDHEDALDVLACRLPSSASGRPRPDRRVARRELLVLADRQRDDRDRQDLLARVRHDLRRGREVRARLAGADSGAGSDLVVHGLLGACCTADAAHGAVGDLRHPADERGVRERVDLDDRRVADAMRATSVSSTFTFVSRTVMSLIVSSVAASLLNVPGTAVSPSSTTSRVMRPAHRRVDRRLARADLASLSAARDCSTECPDASTQRLVHVHGVLSCSSCSSETSCAFVFLISKVRS